MENLDDLDCNNHIASFTREDAVAPKENYIDPIPDTPAGFLAGFYFFRYTYPLSVEARFSHELTPEMSWVDLLLLAKQDYERIYREEDEDCGPTGNIPGMLNRASSKGKYGIWGHHLSDLYFEGVKVDYDTKMVDFIIGS